MGSGQSAPVASQMNANSVAPQMSVSGNGDISNTPSPLILTTEPPKPMKVESFEEKIWRKFTSQPLVPIGCIGTAYFLASGIKSFSDRDPVKSQRMMRNRVIAQFATIMVFIGYMGMDNFDLRLAPMYQDAKKVERMLKEEAEQQGGK